MEEALQIPLKVIVSFSKMQKSSDPWLNELIILTNLLRVQITYCKWTNQSLPAEYEEKLKRLSYMRDMTWQQLTDVITVADPETIEDLKKGMNDHRDNEDLVESYFSLFQEALEDVVAFPPVGGKADLSPRIVADKFQEISAILSAQGLKWLPGYAPAQKSGSDELAELVISKLGVHPELAVSLDVITEEDGPNSVPLDRVFTPIPNRSVSSPVRTVFKGLRPQWDRCASDAANAALGKAGEEFVVELERLRLVDEGRADLAQNVVWTAMAAGDGAGYDISSFNADGSLRLIEVKTTKGNQTTPFYLTANEVRVSGDRPKEFWLYRVYNFDGKANGRIFCMPGALDGGELTLTPTMYRAVR